MGIWKPELPRRMVVMNLAEGDQPTYTYKLSLNERKVFLDGAAATLSFMNSFKQSVGVWEGHVQDGVVSFPDVTAADLTNLVRGVTFTLGIADLNGKVREPLWGHVVRNEPRYPDNPDNNTEFVAAKYDWDFGGVAGAVSDPSWRIMNGAPTVWVNPNGVYGVACGILFDDAAMLWYAPFKGDSIQVNYTTISSGAGKSGVAICSNYDMTNYLCITHEAGISNNILHIEVGNSPVTTTSVAQVNHATATGENFTVVYNNVTQTVSVYLGTNLQTPLLSWTDDTGKVDHGPGNRYFGLNWRASLLATGPQFKQTFSAQDIA